MHDRKHNDHCMPLIGLSRGVEMGLDFGYCLREFSRRVNLQNIAAQLVNQPTNGVREFTPSQPIWIKINVETVWSTASLGVLRSQSHLGTDAGRGSEKDDRIRTLGRYGLVIYELHNQFRHPCCLSSTLEEIVPSSNSRKLFTKFGH